MRGAKKRSSSPTLVILKGLPGAGKSTRAKKLLASGRYNVVEKDAVRQQLDIQGDFRKGERRVNEVFLWNIIASLVDGYSVVADSTNLHPNREEELRYIAELTDAKVKVEFVDTPVDQCISQDARRPKDQMVGARVIRGMYNDYLRDPNRR